MTKLDNLATFVEVVRCGSFAEAARRLEVPRSTVSLRVTNLEAELGARLLERSTRKVMLTDEGRALHDKAAGPLDALMAALAGVEGPTGPLSGTIRIAAPADLPQGPLAEAMTSFRRLHPQVRFELGFTSDLVDMLRDNIDIAIRLGLSSRQNTIACTRLNFDCGFFAHVDWLADHAAPEQPGDISELIVMTEPARGLFEQFLRPGVTLPLAAVEVNSFAMIRNLVMLGQGVGILPRQLCVADVEAGVLKEVLPGTFTGPIPIRQSFTTRAEVTRRVKAFAEHLNQYF